MPSAGRPDPAQFVRGGFGAYAVAMQGNQFLVAGALDAALSDSRFAVCRRTPAGVLDPTFDGDGILLDAVADSGSRASAMARQADGWMIVAARDPGPSQTGEGEPAAPEPCLLVVGNPWPTPTTAAVSMAIRVAESAAVSAEVLDVSGWLIRWLGASKRLAAGKQRLTWDGQRATGAFVAVGLYFVRVQSDRQVVSRRLLVTRSHAPPCSLLCSASNTI